MLGHVAGDGEAFASLGDLNRDRASLVIRHSEPQLNRWVIVADEVAAYDQSWLVRVYAFCANVAL